MTGCPLSGPPFREAGEWTLRTNSQLKDTTKSQRHIEYCGPITHFTVSLRNKVISRIASGAVSGSEHKITLILT